MNSIITSIALNILGSLVTSIALDILGSLVSMLHNRWRFSNGKKCKNKMQQKSENEKNAKFYDALISRFTVYSVDRILDVTNGHHAYNIQPKVVGLNYLTQTIYSTTPEGG